MAKTYALVFGIAYVLVALLELLFRTPFGGLLFFTPVHNGIHWVTGILGLVAYAKGGSTATMYAKLFGIVFLLVFVLGIAAPAFLSSVLGYPVNWFYNVVHLVTGLLGLYAGFAGKGAKPMAPKPMGSAPMGGMPGGPMMGK